MSVNGSYANNKITISETKSSASAVDLAGVKVGCMSVLENSTAEIITVSGTKYLKYESGQTIKVELMRFSLLLY